MSQKMFMSGDSAIEAGANQSFLLDADGVWFVEQGQVDVFCVGMASDGTVRTRAHVARVPAGRCLFGNGCASGRDPERAEDAATKAAGGDSVAPDSPGWPDVHGVLQAVGSAGTTLRYLSRAAARERFREAALRAEAAGMIDGWVESIYAGLVAGAMPRDCEALEPPSTARLQSAAMASSGLGVAWIGHLEGQSTLLGKPELPLGGLPIPCSTRAWFVASTDSLVRATNTTAMLDRDDVWASLDAFQSLAARCTLLAMDEQSESERRRQRRRHVERDALMRDAFTELVAAHDATGEPSAMQVRQGAASGSDGHDSLSFACRLIGVELGLPLAPASTPVAPSASDPVVDIARASGVRVRRVLLEDRWWKTDSGPLLGHTGGKEPRCQALTASAMRPMAHGGR